MKERENFSLTQCFCFIQVFNGLDEAQPYEGGKSTLLKLSIRILVSSSNALTDIPRIIFNQISGNSVTQLF